MEEITAATSRKIKKNWFWINPMKKRFWRKPRVIRIIGVIIVTLLFTFCWGSNLKVFNPKYMSDIREVTVCAILFFASLDGFARMVMDTIINDEKLFNDKDGFK